MKRNKYLMLFISLLMITSCKGNGTDIKKEIRMNEEMTETENTDWAYFGKASSLVSDEKITFLNGRTLYGNYYKAGIMGHRKVVKLGNRFSFFCFIAKRKTEGTDAETNITFTEPVHGFESSVCSSQVMLSEPVSKGILGVIENVTVNEFPNSDTKDSDKMTGKETCFGEDNNFCVRDNSYYTDGSELTLTFCEDSRFFLEGKNTAYWSELWACLDFEIEESYIEEQTLSGWKKLNETSVKNYYGRIVLNKLSTVSYDDGTAGYYNHSSGEKIIYSLGTIKNWDFSSK